MSSATSYKRRFAEALPKSQFPGRSLETHLPMDIRSTISRKTWMGDKEKHVVRLKREIIV